MRTNLIQQDLPIQDELDQALLGPIGCVGNRQYERSRSAERSSIVRVEPTSACWTDRVTSTSTMTT